MTLVVRRHTARPVPSTTRRPKSPVGEGSDVELNLVAATVRTGDVEQVLAAGIRVEDFIDPQWAGLFSGVLEHFNNYGQAPSWATLILDRGLFTALGGPIGPVTSQPLAYYVDRFFKAATYDVLAHGVQHGASLLQDRQVDEAAVVLKDALDRASEVGGQGAAGRQLVRGSHMLSAPYEPLQWLVENVWVRGSYGMVGGAEKSLKSYVTMAMALAVASGEPFLERFDVPEAVPVLVYVGEGGRNLYQSRLKRVAGSMNLEPSDLDQLHVEFAAGALDSGTALSRLSQAVKSTGAGLVIIDPWYRFQGGTTNAANLFEQGALLSDVRDAVGEAALIIVHHFNQTGARTKPGTSDLKRLTMAGSAEWSDSWMLVTKDHEDAEAGEFMLDMSLGSRHWGGRSWKVAADIGRVDEVTHQHVGEVRLWVAGDDDLDRLQLTESPVDPAEAVRQDALTLLRAKPWAYTKTELAGVLGGNKSRTLKVLEGLLESGRAEKKPSPDRSRVEVWNAV